MTVSIACIVMSYNSAPFVVETLESILQQTRLPNQLIVTDDFSQDDSRSLIRSWFSFNSYQFESTYLHFPGFRQGTNMILADALKLVSSDYIKPMAADDLLSTQYFQELDRFIGIHRPDAVFTSSYFINEKSYVLCNSNHPMGWMFQHILSCGPVLIHYSILKFMYIPSYSAIFVSTLLRKIRHPDIILLEDWPMWLYLLLNNYSVFFLNSRLVSYRIHQSQLTSSAKPDPLTVKWLAKDKDTIESIVKLYEHKSPLLIRLLLHVDSVLIVACAFLSSSKSHPRSSLIVPVFLFISRAFRKPSLPPYIQLSKCLKSC